MPPLRVHCTMKGFHYRWEEAAAGDELQVGELPPILYIYLKLALLESFQHAGHELTSHPHGITSKVERGGRKWNVESLPWWQGRLVWRDYQWNSLRSLTEIARICLPHTPARVLLKSEKLFLLYRLSLAFPFACCWWHMMNVNLSSRSTQQFQIFKVIYDDALCDVKVLYRLRGWKNKQNPQPGRNACGVSNRRKLVEAFLKQNASREKLSRVKCLIHVSWAQSNNSSFAS